MPPLPGAPGGDVDRVLWSSGCISPPFFFISASRSSYLSTSIVGCICPHLYHTCIEMVALLQRPCFSLAIYFCANHFALQSFTSAVPRQDVEHLILRV